MAPPFCLWLCFQIQGHATEQKHFEGWNSGCLGLFYSTDLLEQLSLRLDFVFFCFIFPGSVHKPDAVTQVCNASSTLETEVGRS